LKSGLFSLDFANQYIGFASSSSDRVVVTTAIAAEKDRATELFLADFLGEKGVAPAAAQIMVGFPFEQNGGVLGIGFD
jgi:RNase H-fold protein (predicted Holliday junction resolvase)